MNYELEPTMAYIQGKYINVELVDYYSPDYNNLTLIINYGSGDIEGLKFDNEAQLNQAIRKLDQCMEICLYG